jgi:iron complex outermembrane receptor protein
MMRLCALLIASLPLGVAAAAAQGVPAPAGRDTVSPDSVRATVLRALVVTGARLAATADTRLPLRATRLDLSGAADRTSAAEAVQRLPGSSASNDQGSRAQPTLDIRGFSLSPVVGVPQGVSVFLDGVRVNEPDAQEVHFDLLPMEAVVDAELLPGPSAVFGKNSLAGALNLRTRRGGDVPELRAGTSVGSFGAREAHVMASGRRRGIDGLALVKGSSDDGYQQLSGGTTRQLYAAVGRRSGTSDVVLSVLYGNDRIFQAGSLPESWLKVARRANYTGGDFVHPELLQVTLRGSDAIGSWVGHGNVFVRRNAIEQLNANAGDPNTHAFVRNASGGGTVELARTMSVHSWPLDLALGGELASSRVGYRVLAEPNEDVPVLPADCAPAGDAALCEDATADGADVGLYAQSILQPSPRLAILMSARGDHVRIPFRDRREPANDGTSTFMRLSPKVGVTYFARTDMRAYASIGSAFRSPAALELACASPEAACPLPFSLGADPPLRPVVAWSYDAGANWSPSPGRSLAISIFRTEVRDEIVFASTQRAAGYFQNVDRTRRQGAELSAATSFAGEMARLSGSYAYVDATYQASAALASALEGNVVRPGSRFAMSPRHRASADLQLRRVTGRAALDATLAARAVSSSFLRGDEANRTPPLPGYVVLDLRAGARWRRTGIALTVANLLDRRYALYGVFATNPKGPYGGPPPAEESVERFLTPAYPRTVTVSASLEP